MMAFRPQLNISQDPSIDPTTYFAAASDAFERVAANQSIRAHLGIGEGLWRLRFNGDRFAARILPALAHLQRPAGDVTFDVSLWDGAASGEAPPPPFWRWENRGPRGVLRDFDDGRFAAMYQAMDWFAVVDYVARKALVWTPDSAQLPTWEIACPLRYLFDLWCRPLSYVRLHGAAVGSAGGCVLIAGRGGAGKSTTSLACLTAGMGYLGDDYVLVDSERLVAYSLYNTGKVSADNLFRLPDLRAHVTNPDRLSEEKAFFYLSRVFPDQIVWRAPIRAIVVPRVTGQHDSAMHPASQMTGLKALAPSTLFQAAEGTQLDFEKIKRLARGLPVYTLEAGTDLSQLPALIGEILRS